MPVSALISDMDELGKKVLDSLQAQCAKREYCTADIRRKALEKLEGNRDAAAEVVECLVADSFVDDARYASAFAREKASLQGWGPIKIRYMLRSKGIGDGVISAALAEVEPEKAAIRMDKLLENKWKTLREDPQGKFKLIKFALTRGYDYPEVEAAVKRLLSSAE